MDSCTGLRPSVVCSCPPAARVRSKRSAGCNGACCMYRVGVAEEMFCAAITQGCAPPASVHVNVWRVHSSLSAALQCIGTQSPYLAQVVPSVKLRGCAAGDDVLASLRRFVCQDKWRWGTKQTADRCTWVAVMLEYIFTCGFQGSFLNKALTAGVLTRRFRDGFLHVLKHHGTVCPAVNGLRPPQVLRSRAQGT